MHGDAGARWRGAGYARGRGGPSGGPGPRPEPGRATSRRPGTGRPGGAPPLEVHHRTGAWSGGRGPQGLRGGPAGGTDAGRGRTGPGPGGPVRRGAGSAASGAAEGRTAARTRARLGTEAGGVEPRGEECVRGHVPERVSGPGGGQPPTAATERPPRPPPRPPRTPPTTCTFTTSRPVHGPTSAAEKRGRISWPRNAAATRSPGSTPARRPRGPRPGRARRPRPPGRAVSFRSRPSLPDLVGPGPPGTAPRRVVGAPGYVRYTGAPPPCEAPHRTTRAHPTRPERDDLAGPAPPAAAPVRPRPMAGPGDRAGSRSRLARAAPCASHRARPTGLATYRTGRPGPSGTIRRRQPGHP